MLQVWLPLTGHIHNLGLSNVTVINNGSVDLTLDGKLGKCATFGSSNYLSATIPNSSDTFSVSWWLYLSSVNTGLMPWGIGYFNPIYDLCLNTGDGSNNPWYIPGTTTKVSQFTSGWHHFVVTGDGTTNKLYLDGVHYGNAKTYRALKDYGTSLRISGWSYDGGYKFNNGKISDFRLYDSALSQQLIHDLSKGLVLHYPFNDEYVDTTIYDCSGYCNNGTVTGSLQVVDDSPRYKKSTKITTSNTIKTIVPILNNIYSFSWWYNKADFGAGDMMWGYGDGNRINPLYSLCFNVGDGNSSPWYIPGTTTKITAPSGNTWHHFVITGDGSTSTLYVDGSRYGTCINFKPITGSILHINGWSSGKDYRTNGKISDFRIYSTALSEDDIKELYNTSAIINNNNTLLAYEFVE